jgi:hypothetical protein
LVAFGFIWSHEIRNQPEPGKEAGKVFPAASVGFHKFSFLVAFGGFWWHSS